MFKDYKKLLKNLRQMQDELWRDSMTNFPGPAFPSGMNEWQQKTLDNVNHLMEQAVESSLHLQREWLNQWVGRATRGDLKPKTFAELSEDARRSAQHWLQDQNRLWDQWLDVIRESGGQGKSPDFSEWEKSMQESMQSQMSLFNRWSEMTDFNKLSGKEFEKLFNQINKSMEKSIETQQRLWSLWFDPQAGAGKPEGKVAEEPQPKKQAAPAKPAAGAVAKPAQAEDDLTQIRGIGPGLAKKLKENGVTTLKQIASWTAADIARMEESVIRFSGRIKREQWVKQAKALIS
jgi:predicted flap endonuclease-1-like 5' DNA nuclease